MLGPERKKFKAKKISALIGLCLLSIILGCGSSSDNTDSASSAKAITAFSLSGVEGTINQTAKTISVIMPTGTDVAALVATFATTGASVVVGSTVQVSGTTDNDFTSPVIYTVIANDATTQEYEVTVTVVTKSITTFSLNGVQGAIDQTAKTITVTMPTGTNVTALVATFATTGTNVKIGSTVQVSGTTAHNFTSPVVYTVTGVDATTQDYTVTVIIESANKLATAVNISMTANTPAPHAGIFCTATRSITGNIDVTDIDGGTNVEWEWYDNGVLQPCTSCQTTLSEANGHVTATFLGVPSPPAPEPFQYHHTIMFKVTVDGGEANGGVSASTSAKIL
jgi:hypothetical protein